MQYSTLIFLFLQRLSDTYFGDYPIIPWQQLSMGHSFASEVEVKVLPSESRVQILVMINPLPLHSVQITASASVSEASAEGRGPFAETRTDTQAKITVRLISNPISFFIFFIGKTPLLFVYSYSIHISLHKLCKGFPTYKGS